MHVSQAQLPPAPTAVPDPAWVDRDPDGDASADLPPPSDRGHLLRRTSRSRFHEADQTDDDGIRLRRRRRVGASFSGIPGLSRNGY